MGTKASAAGPRTATGALRVGVVGADINHALEYASIVHPRPDATAPMLDVPPLDPTMEARMAGVREAEQPLPTEPWTVEALRSEPALRDVRVTCWWGADRGAAESMAARLGVDCVIDDLAEMVERVDAVLVCAAAARDHRDLALPFLSAGIPTFIDKPFTDDVAAARELVVAAAASAAVLFASSPWKWAPCVTELLDRMSYLGGVRTAVATAPSVRDALFYTTHSVELLQRVLGTGAATVSCTRTDVAHLLTIGYDDGRLGIVNGLRDTAWLRHLTVYGEDGYVQAEISNAHRDEGKISMIVEFFRSVRAGRHPLPLAYPLEATQILIAAERSAARGGARVPLTKTG